MARGRRGGPDEINASSMADIAFLLLIFFLVTTTIDADKGILHKLPAWIPPEEQPDVDINDRNVLEILVNSNDQLLVEEDYIKIDQLRQITIDFISNNGRDPRYSDSPQDAVVSLKNDRMTSYGIYIEVQNELKAAYNYLRDKEAKALTGGSMTYEEVDNCADPKENPDIKAREKCQNIKGQIKDKYPMKISEAEPK